TGRAAEDLGRGPEGTLVAADGNVPAVGGCIGVLQRRSNITFLGAQCWVMPTKIVQPSLYELNIRLLSIDPPIWRRLQVQSTMLLCCLHDAFQAVMGWTDSHLHQFEKEGKFWGDPETEFGDHELIDESNVSVGNLLRAESDSIIYLYDFGDNW